MWRSVADLFRAAARRQNVLKPDARLNSEECKQVCATECNIFPAEKAVEKRRQFASDKDEKKQRHDEREERLKDCRQDWESSWFGALGWSGALVLGWYASQPPCWRRFLRRRSEPQRVVDRFTCRSLLDVVSRYALGQPSPSLRHTLPPVVVVSGETDQAGTSTQYGPITAEQAVAEAAEKFTEAQNQLMGAVENNKGVQLMKAGEHKRAVAFFKRASSFENARAAYNLGICYEKGLGTSPNLEEAARWYELASNRGHAGAMYNLGVFYAHGLGHLTVDRRRAKQLFQSAADLGQPDATRALDKIRQSEHAKRSADDMKALYKVLGVEVPAVQQESAATDLRSLRVSDVVVQALGLIGPRSEMPDVMFEGRKLPGIDGSLGLGAGAVFPSGSGVVQPVSFCKSEVLSRLPSSIYANYIRA